MTVLQRLEQQFDFRYPELYHQLYADDMLDWGIYGPEWITRRYPILRKNPPLLLFANEFELCSFADIESRLKELADPDYWMNIQPGLRFIPFAQNGAGDMYCFFFNGQQSEDIPVVLLWHDSNRVQYKAKKLQDFIFRSMLEAVADIEEAEYNLLGEENFNADLQNVLRTHSKYLYPGQQQVVAGLYQTTRTNNPLISEEQLQEILNKEISWKHLDEEFQYQTVF